MENRDRTERLTPIALILVFSILAAGIITTGYVNYRNYEKRYRVEVERQLSVIGNLKAGELALWRKERLGDGHVFSKNPVFYALVRRYIENPDDIEAKRLLQSWLSQVQASYGYCRVFLLDSRGVERMSVPDTHEPVPSHLLKDLPQTLRSGDVHFLDFYRDAQGQSVHLSVVAPILDEQKGNTAIGLLVLDIDPEQYLYPFISRWPTPSRTAETLLVRREGNDALFLNQLKFRKNTALNLRIPLESQDVASVKAALGQEGIVECKDYRGVPVIADVRAVPDSPWFLNSRMDTEEVYAPLRERLWLVVVLVGAMVMCAGACMGLVWRSQTASFYRERYEAAQALQDSEEKLKAVVYGSPIPKFMIGRDHRLIYWNKALEEISGIEAGKVIGTNQQWKAFGNEERPCLADLLVDGDLERIPDWYGAKCCKSKLLTDAYEATDFFPMLGNEGKWLHFTSVTIRDSNGDIMGAVETIEDITESKRAEDALRTSKEELEIKVVERTEGLRNANEQLQSELAERKRFEKSLQDSEERLRMTLEASQIGIWDWDVKTDQWYASPTYYTMLGYEPKAGLSDRSEWLERVHPDDRAFVKETIQSVLDGTFKEYQYEARLRHADGTYRWQHVRGMSVKRDEAGKVTRMLGIRMDIGQRKRAEEALQAASKYNRSLIEASLDPLVTISAEGKITDVNAGTERVTGYSREELIGTDFADYFTDPEKAGAGYQQVFKGGSVKDYELEIRHKSGELTPVMYNASLFRDEYGGNHRRLRSSTRHN